MKIKIHTDEGLELLKFQTDVKKRFEENGVAPVDANKDMKKYVINFLKKRGIARPKIWNFGTFTFKNVDMHVDNMSPKSAGTLIFMIKGRGELSHWDGKKIHHTHMDQLDAVFFDFNLPHAFKSNHICQALLVDIPKRYKKNLCEYLRETNIQRSK